MTLELLDMDSYENKKQSYEMKVEIMLVAPENTVEKICYQYTRGSSFSSILGYSW